MWGSGWGWECSTQGSLHSLNVPGREKRTRVATFDVQGRPAAAPADGEFAAGSDSLTLDTGSPQPGLNFVRMLAPGANLQQRAVVMRRSRRKAWRRAAASR